MKKLAVLYVFHEYGERVRSFLKNAIFFDENVDFYIISNNKTNVFTAPDYVKILYRDNIGYDFGGWSDALITLELYKKYENFIFVNSSVIGPFVPDYYQGKWTDVFVNGLNSQVKLFGSTINTMGDPLNSSHVQSYIFSIDNLTLKYLIECEIFSLTNIADTFQEAILKKEVLMSRKIIEKGWNIGCLFPCSKGIDFSFQTNSPDKYNFAYKSDLMYPEYRGTLWNEYDLVFIKGNR